MSDTDQNTEVRGPTASDEVGKLFIIGARRSGTTWTLSLLANHPQIVGILHTNLMRALKELGIWWDRSDPYDNAIVGTEAEKANIRDFLRDDEFFDSCRRLSDTVFNKAVAAKDKARVIVESQPENIDYLPFLNRLYPHSRVLHVVRDPRAVFASWKSAANSWSSNEVFNTNLIRFCHRWKREISAAREFGKDSDQYREVQYERLKDQGVFELTGIYGWLNLNSSEPIAEASIEACQLEKMRTKKMMPGGFFRKGQSRGWESELSDAEVACIEYLLAELMDDLGYHRVNTGVPRKPWMVRKYEFARAVYRRLENKAPARLSTLLKRLYVG